MASAWAAILSSRGLLVVVAALAWTARAAALPRNGTSSFTLRLTWEPRAPAGIPRRMLLVNGQSPGPVLALDQDDWVEVHVVNASPFDTTIHFHGIEMLGTPEADGVPGVTQDPILPGQDYTYRFWATQHGSFWYHSHFRGQIEDGLYGAVSIRPRAGGAKPFGLMAGGDADAQRAMEAAERRAYPLVISDLSRLESTDKWDMTVAVGVEVSCYDALLFNGKGRVSCLAADDMAARLGPVQLQDLALVPGSTLTDKGCLPAEVMAAFGGNLDTFRGDKVLPGVFDGCRPTEGDDEAVPATYSGGGRDWIAIDLVGATNFVTPVVSIDGHDMWVYAMDGMYIEPRRVQAIPMNNGERYGVLVAPRRAGRFKIRANANSAPQMIVGHAVLDVVAEAAPGGDEAGGEAAAFIDIAGNPTSPDVVVFDQLAARPFPPDPVPRSADATFVLNMKIDGASYLWALNSSRLMPTDGAAGAGPSVLQAPRPWARDNVTITTRNGSWVDLVFLAGVFPVPPHPIHKHGSRMFRIGGAPGPWAWASVDDAVRRVPDRFNLDDPPRRDGFVTLAARDEPSWVVMRYHVVNPGAWLLHCHINNHLLGGMEMVIQDGVDAWPGLADGGLGK